MPPRNTNRKEQAKKSSSSSSMPPSTPLSSPSGFGSILNGIFFTTHLLLRSIPVVILMLPSLAILLMVHNPYVSVNIALFVDFYSPWILFESKFYDAYHEYLISTLDEKEEKPLIEITPQEATMENIIKLSKEFTWPLVIRGMLNNSSGIEKWADPAWWEDKYSDEEVLCGTLSEVVEDCTIKTFFQKIREKQPFYISGASVIFKRNPELHDMIDNAHVRSIEPGKRQATQIFMGVPDMGSDIHCAIAVNIFRQIVGQKKWWFIPPSQTPYLKPSINVNGFSAHTKTLVGKGGATPSPWLSKIERYTTVLDPGDVLINPPFFWHGIINLGEKDDNSLVIGAPSRYIKGYSTIAGFKSNVFLTFNAIFSVARRYGIMKTLRGELNLQQDIANNRRQREKKDLKAVDDAAEVAIGEEIREKDSLEDVF